MEKIYERKKGQPRTHLPSKNATKSWKNHTFEPFSQRVERTRIDPIRRPRGHQQDELDLSTNVSHFRSALDRWNESNLSENYSAFSEQIDGISDSLPQILHHEDQIIQLLIQFIKKGTSVSLEPLLDLVSQLAHDLGSRFMEHLPEVIDTVIQLASTNTDIEVIEWCFNCLTWLFKYLSKLLVPDLCSLYDQLVPLLGKKQRQKHFVSRFAAEAFSFLIRRAGAEKEQNSLRIIVSHVMKDISIYEDGKSREEYLNSVAIVFSEAVLGIRGTISAPGKAVFEKVIATGLGLNTKSSNQLPTLEITQDILIAILNKVDQTAIPQILEVILLELERFDSSHSYQKMSALLSMLMHCIVVKKGDGVTDWKRLFLAITSSRIMTEENPNLSMAIPHVLAALAVAHKMAPIDFAVQNVKAFDNISETSFLRFSEFYAQISGERFRIFVLPVFQRFFTSNWQRHREEICVLLQNLSETRSLETKSLRISPRWQEEFLSSLQSMASKSISDQKLYYCSSLLALAPLTTVDLEAVSIALVNVILESSTVLAADNILLDVFQFGQALQFVSEFLIPSRKSLELWKIISSNAKRLRNYEIFWTSTLAFVEARKEMLINASQNHEMKEAITMVLQSPSHAIRLCALKLASLMSTAEDGETYQALELAILTEEMEPTIESMRAMSRYMRQLSTRFSEIPDEHWLLRALPSFCFGLLRIHFASLWEDASEALKAMCARPESEAYVSNIAFSWLDHSGTPHLDEKKAPVSRNDGPFLNREINSMVVKVQSVFMSPTPTTDRLREHFFSIHNSISEVTSLDKSQAIRVLRAIPDIAEKRSKLLIPWFLNWSTWDFGTRNEQSEEAQSLANVWTRKEKKDLLALFGDFKNPKALYQSTKVYHALLRLLCHGDVEIQKSSFKAILTWKNETTRRYEKELLKFFDDAKFREQITVFLDIGHGEESLREEDMADIMPIILRILYGRVTSGKDDQKSNRKAVFGLLSTLGELEMNQFLDIAFQQVYEADLIAHNIEGSVNTLKIISTSVDQRRMVGLMNMLKDLLNTLGSRTAPFANRLVSPTVFALITTDRALRATNQFDTHESQTVGRTSKSIRNLALHCLAQLLNDDLGLDLLPYLFLVAVEVLQPRSGLLHLEVTQAVSGLFKLIGALAESRYVEEIPRLDESLIPELILCLGTTAVKDEVKLFILADVLAPIISHCKDYPAGNLAAHFAEQRDTALIKIQEALEKDMSKELLEQSISFVESLVELTQIGSEPLIRTSVYLLRQPARRVNPSCKLRLLRILSAAIPVTQMSEKATQEVFEVVCTSFTFDIPREGRILLGEILLSLTTDDLELQDIAELVQDLNSYSTSKLDEPDFERRSRAYRTIESQYLAYSARVWQPILANALFFVKDTDELVIRASASHTVQLFIDAMSKKLGPSDTDDVTKYTTLLEILVLNNIRSNIRDQPESVKSEYVAILSRMALQLPDYLPTNDLKCLLWSDEESSFFNNILHIQQHRRQRAMRRLAEEAGNGTLTSNTISHILIPLLESFIYSTDQNVQAGEASATIGTLAEWIDFHQFRSIIRRYISYISAKTDRQESTLKLLDSFSKALEIAARSKLSGAPTSKLAQTLPDDDKLPKIVSQEFLPRLYGFLHEKDESYVSRRVAVSIIASRIIQVLPPDEFALRFPPLLTDTCNILRSKDQTARDLTRNALTTICSIAGPRSFGFIVNELRRALQRGFYLHVLGFTVHSILEANISNIKPGDLDYCVSDVATVIMDDIFGSAGQEKEELQYMKSKGSVKEIKGRKSFDTMQLMASVTTLSHILQLIRPIELLLLERMKDKMLSQVDELLRRIELGLSQNSSFKNREVLVFCYQIIQETFKLTNSKGSDKPADVSLSVPLPKRRRTQDGSLMSAQGRSGKIVRFALEIVRNTFRKHKDLKTPANISGFLPVIGDGLLSDHQEIKMAAIRLFTGIVGVPMDEIERNAPVYVAECVRIIETSQANADELFQAALKLISAILRERRNVNVSEETIAALLKRIKPDLQVINQQGAAFNFVRSVLTRKYIIPEVYALIDGPDGIAAISIRDHDRTTRDLARGVYFQFLMDYPQEKKRFAKQLTFLNRNLEYEHVEGRQSVMEALNLLLTKVGQDLIDQIIKESFWPVVSIMINDESSDCRTMAAGLMRTMFSRGDDAWITGVVSLIRNLFNPSNQYIQIRTALQTWTIYLESKQGEVRDVSVVIQRIQDILSVTDPIVEDTWQINYYSLHTFLMICKILPDVGFSGKLQHLWKLVWNRLAYPHTWVKYEAAKLFGQLASQFSASQSLKRLPLTEPRGLKILSMELCDLARDHVQIFNHHVTEELASQTVRNLAFIARIFSESDCLWQLSSTPVTALETPSNSEESDSDSLTKTQPSRSALYILLARLAGILRRESMKRTEDEDELKSRRANSLIPRIAALQLLAAILSSLEIESIKESIPVILRPLVRLTESSMSGIPVSSDAAFKEKYGELIANSQKLMDMLQKELGTTEFVRVLQDVKARIMAKRDERRLKRQIEAVSMPEIAEKKRARKREKEKIRQKEKGMVQRGKRRGW